MKLVIKIKHIENDEPGLSGFPFAEGQDFDLFEPGLPYDTITIDLGSANDTNAAQE